MIKGKEMIHVTSFNLLNSKLSRIIPVHMNCQVNWTKQPYLPSPLNSCYVVVYGFIPSLMIESIFNDVQYKPNNSNLKKISKTKHSQEDIIMLHEQPVKVKVYRCFSHSYTWNTHNLLSLYINQNKNKKAWKSKAIL